MSPPAVGRPAPDFTLPADDGRDVTLSALRGRPVVLFFYPRDDTPTCTAEACGFRDAFPRLDGAGALVLGVSPDTVRSHRRFREKHALPYPLLADVGHLVCEAYGVWREKVMYGRRYMGVARTTVVVDAGGVVARVFEQVRAAGHADEVLLALGGLG